MEPLITDWIIAIGTFVTGGMVGVLIWTIANQKKQLLVSNFEIITNYIGSEKTRYARRILIKHYGSPISDNYFEKFPKDGNMEFDEYNEWAKYIGAIYNRVGFLLKQDKKLKEKIIAYHGFTMGIQWKIFEKFQDKWKDEDSIKEYVEFKEIGDLCYCEWKNEINKFLDKKKEQNKNRIQFEWLIEKRKLPIEW